MLKNYFPELTGVRAIAAIMVFIHHYNPFGDNILGGVLRGFAKELHTGVTFFFVLSGFLIAYRYSELKNFNFKKYFLYRAARVYPMYFILTTLTLIVSLPKSFNISINELIIYILNISFLRGFFEEFKFSLVAQGWSLTVEETFYILAPLLFFALIKIRYFIYLLPILLVSFGYLLVGCFQNLNWHGFFSNDEFMLIYTFFGRSTEFIVGIGLALLVKSDVKLPKGTTYIGFFFTLLFIYLLYLLQNNGVYPSGILTPFGKIVNTFLLPLLGISLFYYGLITEKSKFSAILGSKLFVLLGKSSYIFYLIHLGVIHSFVNTYVSKNYFISFVSLQLISIVLFLLIEEPLNNFLRTKINSFSSKVIDGSKA